MTFLKDMIENIISENEDNAKVNFHSYIIDKMQGLNEGGGSTISVIFAEEGDVDEYSEDGETGYSYLPQYTFSVSDAIKLKLKQNYLNDLEEAPISFINKLEGLLDSNKLPNRIKKVKVEFDQNGMEDPIGPDGSQVVFTD